MEFCALEPIRTATGRTTSCREVLRTTRARIPSPDQNPSPSRKLACWRTTSRRWRARSAPTCRSTRSRSCCCCRTDIPLHRWITTMKSWRSVPRRSRSSPSVTELSTRSETLPRPSTSPPGVASIGSRASTRRRSCTRTSCAIWASTVSCCRRSRSFPTRRKRWTRSS
uniref:(northern house mosquito) hypothetical protein n=1 Tax=Culex pipiens TaxID=7175 RepID=A0A8D8HKK9_CULPI